MIEVLQPGLYTTVQDLGRPGYRSYGMPSSGALDPFLASIANRLAGNEPGAPLLEFALLGPSLKALSSTWLALAAFSTRYLAAGGPVREFSAFPLNAGDVLQFVGMRSWFGYLAASGGLVATRLLGSASTYEAGRVGRRLQRGDTLETGISRGGCFSLSTGALDWDPSAPLSILPALHTSLFAERERRRLVEQEFRIAPQSNRMGIHLEGPPIEPPRVQRSAPALPGAIQVPLSRQMIVLGPEGPTTGGYPQIAILSRSSWTTIAFHQPGDAVRFDWIDVESARRRQSGRYRIFDRKEAWRRLQ